MKRTNGTRLEHGVNVDFGLRDERGRKLGAVPWFGKHTNGYHAGATVTRDGHYFGPVTSLTRFDTEEEARREAQRRVDGARARYERKYGEREAARAAGEGKDNV